MSFRILVVLVGLSLLTGCYTIERGFRYEYDGRVLRADGKTPVKGASVRLARAADAEGDKVSKTSTKNEGRYVGVLETTKGWKFEENFGFHGGPTKAPTPPALDEVIVYVEEKGVKPMGYRVKVPAEAQAEAYSGVRKLHVPDLLIHDPPATKPAATKPAGGF